MSVSYERKQTLVYLEHAHQLSPVPHLHKELELIYVHEGGSRATANRNTCQLRPGDVFLAFPYQVHYYQDSLIGHYSVLAFPSSILLTMENAVNSNELVNKVFHIEPGSPEEEFLFRIFDANGAYSIATRCAYISLLMTKLLPQCELIPLQKTSNQTVKNILEYCNKHYTEHLTLDTLAQNLHLNKYYISHSLNKQINMRLNTFVNSLRTEAACQMLKETDQKVSMIAQAVGYDTIRSFNRAFLEITGMTPKEYRERRL